MASRDIAEICLNITVSEEQLTVLVHVYKGKVDGVGFISRLSNLWARGLGNELLV